MTAALLNGKNPSPSEIVKRSVRHSLTFQTGKSGLTTSDIFKRPGIYHKGKVWMRKKYEDDDKQSRMYHRYLLPGEELESHKDVGEQVKITVSDLYQELSDQREELLQDLYSRFREKSEHIEETIDDLVTAVENVKNHVVESEETVKSVKSALERVNNQVAVLTQARLWRPSRLSSLEIFLQRRSPLLLFNTMSSSRRSWRITLSTISILPGLRSFPGKSLILPPPSREGERTVWWDTRRVGRVGAVLGQWGQLV